MRIAQLIIVLAIAVFVTILLPKAFVLFQSILAWRRAIRNGFPIPFPDIIQEIILRGGPPTLSVDLYVIARKKGVAITFQEILQRLRLTDPNVVLRVLAAQAQEPGLSASEVRARSLAQVYSLLSLCNESETELASKHE